MLHCLNAKTVLNSSDNMNLINFMLLVIVLLVAGAKCFPLKKQSVMGVKGIPTVEAFKFMKKFGYIEEGDGSSEALFTEEGLQDVIKNIQKFGAIPQTGKLDNATMKLMVSPRCGLPDVIRTSLRKKRFILGPTAWNKRNITFFVANWPGSMSADEVAKYMTIGLDTWGRYARLKFTRVYDNNADIIVAFGSGCHGDSFCFDGPGNILAHAYFPYESEGLGGDIHFDNDEKWTTDPNKEEGVDFLTVAVHELGHSLGLSHSPIETSVMFPYYTGSGTDVKLGYDDILAMYELYIKRRLKDDSGYPEHQTTTTERYRTTQRRQTERTTTKRYQTQRTTKNYYTTRYTTTTLPTHHTISYHGDDESVDDHKNHDGKHKIPTTNSPSLPDICEGKYDAVATLRGEVFFFKEQYIWRLRKEYDLVPGYPIPLRQMFPKFPKHIKKIDAAYERPDGMMVFFTGNKYWVFDGTNFVENSPKSITLYGLPNYLSKIDAVQTWAKNGKTYMYLNDQFWRYNETSKTMDEGYPMHMERWRGVPTHLDSATTWRGMTYFFKDRCYWKFDNNWIITTDNSPLPTPQTWIGCPKEEIEYCVPKSAYENSH